MHIALTTEQERQVNFLVKSGGYAAPADLLSDALQALEEKQTLESIKRGISQIKAGQGVPADTVFARLEAKYKAML